MRQTTFGITKPFSEVYLERLAGLRETVMNPTPEAKLALMNQIDEERRTPRAKGVRPKRDPLFDALATIGGIVNLDKITKPSARTIAAALSMIREVSPEVTPEMLNRAAESYRQKHRDWALTAMSLAKHWAEVVPSRPTRAHDIYTEPTGWRPYAAQIHPQLAEKTWQEINVGYGHEILRKMNLK